MYVFQEKVTNLKRQREYTENALSEKLKESKSIIAVLGSNVPSHSNYDRKAKAKFPSFQKFSFTVEFMISNVAYRANVYRTGANA